MSESDEMRRMGRADVREKMARMPTNTGPDGADEQVAAAWEDDLGQMMGKYFTALVLNGFSRQEAMQLASEFQARLMTTYMKGRGE